jgi:hypothetical protein
VDVLERSTILMIRHGEKPGDPCAKDAKGEIHLSPAGQWRAEAYVEYFETYVARAVDGSGSQPIKLDRVFAAASSHSSHRPRETVAPLVKATGLPFDHDVADERYVHLVHHLEGRKYVGANILICWHHGKILDFADALLKVNDQPAPSLPSASTWPGSYPCAVFGWLLQIRYDEHGIVRPTWTRCINTRLMAGDTTDPP